MTSAPATAQLYDYQREHASRYIMAALCSPNSAALDGSDTGAGKMWIAAWCAGKLDVTPLVIAPKSTLPEWRRVAAMFGVQVEAVGYEKIRGVRTKYLTDPPYCRFTETYYQGPYFRRLAASEWGREVAKGNGTAWKWNDEYQLIIFDEVHRCGGMTSLNSKLLIAAKRQAERVLCCSATAADDPRQLKALGYTLGLFELNGFRNWLLRNGCEPGVFGGFALSDDPEAVRQALGGIGRTIFQGGRGGRLRKEEIPGFPKSHIATRLIPDETGKAAAIVTLLNELYQRNESLEKLNTLRQALELLRCEALADLAGDYALSSKVVIFVNFRATVRELVRLLGNVPVIEGGISDEARESIKHRFQAGEVPILICNNQAGGEGIGLHAPNSRTKADERTTLISPCYSGRQMKQVLGRVPRLGGGFSQQFLCYFADTPEEEIAASVSRRLGNLDALNDGILHGGL